MMMMIIMMVVVNGQMGTFKKKLLYWNTRGRELGQEGKDKELYLCLLALIVVSGILLDIMALTAIKDKDSNEW